MLQSYIRLADGKVALKDGVGHWTEDDTRAAWELYVELSTRVTTQYLASKEDGDDDAIFRSFHALFGVIRGVLRRYGPGAGQISRVVIPALNGLVRPFMATWHGPLQLGPLSGEEHVRFRADLEQIQYTLRSLTALLAVISGIWDEKLDGLESFEGLEADTPEETTENPTVSGRSLSEMQELQEAIAGALAEARESKSQESQE